MKRAFHKLRITEGAHTPAASLRSDPAFSPETDTTLYPNLTTPGEVLAQKALMEVPEGFSVAHYLREYRAGRNAALDQTGNVIATGYGIAFVDRESGVIDVEQAFMTNQEGTKGWFLAGPSIDGSFPDAGTVETVLRQHGVHKSLPLEVIGKELIHTAGRQKWILVARGIDPRPGHSKRVQLLVETSRSPSDPDPLKVDHRERSRYLTVKAGQPLMREHPEVPPISGTNIFGDTLPGIVQKHPLFLPGRNVVQVPGKPLEYAARIGGLVSITAEFLHVHEVLDIPGDVDLTTGNIRFQGTVRVAGSVRSGMIVEAAGDISVEGMIEAANVTSGGTISAVGGIIGKGNARVRAEGTILTKFAQNANLHAGDMILVEQSVLNSFLYAGDSIAVTGKPGAIRSGILVARKRIEAHEAGSDAQSATILRAGLKHELTERKKDLQADLDAERAKSAEIIHRLKTLHGISKLEELPRIFQGLPREKRLLIAGVIAQLKEVTAEIKRLSVLLDSVDANLQAQEPSTIMIGVIHRGVRLVIDDKEKEAMTDLSGTFSAANL